jgi:hypothetical protein
VISEPQEGQFTARQIATRGSGAEHCGQLIAAHDIRRFLDQKVDFSLSFTGQCRNSVVLRGFRNIPNFACTSGIPIGSSVGCFNERARQSLLRPFRQSAAKQHQGIEGATDIREPSKSGASP